VQTPINAYAETAALYAVLTEDHQDAQRIVGDMLPGERAVFANQLDTLRRMLTDRFGNDLSHHGIATAI
jgi:hypothetical protein